MSCCNVLTGSIYKDGDKLQYRKRYELLQLLGCEVEEEFNMLQYRKRYELLQRNIWYGRRCISSSYNTASGMSCCNVVFNLAFMKFLELQYRKRYELLQRVCIRI